MINAAQHGMIYVGTGMMPAANNPASMNAINGSGPEVHNRIGSFAGPMAASFQVNPPESPSKGDLEIVHAYGQCVAEITLQFLRGRSN